MATNILDILTAGDCSKTWHHILKSKMYMPLGTTTHKQGRVAGENMVGGNGGIFRKPSAPLFQRQKDAMRAGVKAAGIKPPEDEEEFYVGKLNYAKGMRLKY